MDFQDETCLHTLIKEEVDLGINRDTELPSENKPESIVTQSSVIQSFEEIKQEVIPGDNAIENVSEINVTSIQLQVKEEFITSEILDDQDNANCDIGFDRVKQENDEYSVEDDFNMQGELMTTALGQVEACLNDDDERVEFENLQSEVDNNMKIKTETITSQALDATQKEFINGLAQPNTYEGFHIPSVLNNVDCTEDVNIFQLNSITGDLPPLSNGIDNVMLEMTTDDSMHTELLNARNKRRAAEQKANFMCPKCTKSYRDRHSLRRHLYVHNSIEKRANGIIQGMITKKINFSKLLNANLESRKKNMTSTGKSKLKRTVRNKAGAPTGDFTSDQPNNDNKEITEQHVTDGNNTTNNTKAEYKCTCGKVFHRRSPMETCLRSHNEGDEEYRVSRSVSCATCLKQFNNKEELAIHRKRFHSKRFPCKFCPTDYDTRKELFKHLQLHQKLQLMEYKVISEIMLKKQKLHCFMCSKNCLDLTELKTHVMESHKSPYICPHCSTMFPKIIDFGIHTKKYHPEVENQTVLNVLEAYSRLIKAWKCEVCDQQFLQANKLAVHKIDKHGTEKTERNYQCSDCQRVFITKSGLQSHRRMHHRPDDAEQVKDAVEGIMCLECRKICKDINALTSHMRLHSPDRKFPCKFCDFRFPTQEKRKSHAEIHTGDMKFVCFICEYQCSSEHRLKQHKMSLKHINMKEYLLTGKPLIEESTSKVDDKKELKKSESVKKRKKDSTENDLEEQDCSNSSAVEVSCDICGEKFSSVKKMLKHKERHPFIEFPNEDTPTRIFFK